MNIELEMQTQKEFISNFKNQNPIRETSGSGTGTYKWKRYLDGIDLRYGHNSRKSAEMSRARAAGEAWATYAHQNESVPCPKCGKLEKRQTMEITGECNDCMLKN